MALPFVSGRGLEAAAGRSRPMARPSSDLILLDSNENPNGPSGPALDAIRATLDLSCRYPFELLEELTGRLAKHYGVAAAQVLVGCGSTEHLQLGIDAFTTRGRWLVTAAPSFETPVTYAAARGIPVVAVPVGADLRLDLDAMLARSLGAGLVYVCNPNNPTGTAHPKGAVEEFVRRVLAKAPAAHVMVDEAYFEYADLAGYGSLVPMALDDPRVFVLRTFSKVFGMAGLRVGYAIGRPETMAAMSRFRLRIGVNALGAAAALASIGDQRHLEREVKLNSEARAFTRGFFEQAGYTCGASQTNFLMVGIRRPIEEFKAACEKKGVAIGRPFPPLTEHARITIGTMDEMRRAVPVFDAVLQS